MRKLNTVIAWLKKIPEICKLRDVLIQCFSPETIILVTMETEIVAL